MLSCKRIPSASSLRDLDVDLLARYSVGIEVASEVTDAIVEPESRSIVTKLEEAAAAQHRRHREEAAVAAASPRAAPGAKGHRRLPSGGGGGGSGGGDGDHVARSEVTDVIVEANSRDVVTQLEEAAAAEHRRHVEAATYLDSPATPRSRAWSWSRMPFTAQT